jgi:hypothetical protein
MKRSMALGDWSKYFSDCNNGDGDRGDQGEVLGIGVYRNRGSGGGSSGGGGKRCRDGSLEESLRRGGTLGE